MLAQSLTRTRRADREEKIHNAAIRKAFERKANREFLKSNPDVLTEEEDLEEEKKVAEKEFFDVCNEKSVKKDKPKKSKKSKKSNKESPKESKN